MLLEKLFFYSNEDCRFRCLARNFWFTLFISLTVISVVYPDPLSRLGIFSYLVPLVVYWTPLFQSVFNLDSVPEWRKWILFGVLFVPIIGVSLLLITVLGLATMKYRGCSDYGESSSAHENRREDSGSDDQLENSDTEDKSSKHGISEKSSTSESNDLLNRLKEKLEKRGYNQDIVAKVFENLNHSSLDDSQINTALHLAENDVRTKRVLLCLVSGDLTEQKINSMIDKANNEAETDEKDKSEHFDVDDRSEQSESNEDSSSSDDSGSDSSSNVEDVKDKSEHEKTSEDDDLLKITLTDLPNINLASIEGEGSSYEYALSPGSKYILCYQEGHRDVTGEKEEWVEGEVILMEVVETESEDILNGSKVAKFDFDRPLNADVNDRGKWLVVNSNSNAEEDSVKWFDKENLKAESEFDVNIMNSEISNEGISVLVTAPGYSTVYCFRNGVKEWEKIISDNLPFRIMDIEFIPEEEEIRLESHDENSGFTMSYTGEIMDDSVNDDDKNRSVNNYDRSLLEDSGSFPKKSYQSNLKFSKEEKEAIRDKFNEHEEIIRKEEKLDYVGTKNSSYKSSFLVRRNDNTLPLEKSVKQYYENKGWWISMSLEEKENLVVNIFSDDSSVDIPKGETIADKVYSFLKNHSRGLPDLFAYSPSENKFYFIEVKSQNDTLSLVQKKWYNEFLELKPDIEYIVHKVNSKSIRPQTLEQTSLKGISYTDIPLSYFNNISKNETVELEPEPDNQHDPLAVKVSHNGKFIGYLPENLDYKKKVIEAINKNDYSAEITHFHRASSKREYSVFMKIDFLKSN